MKAVSMLQVVQEKRQVVDGKASEEHPIQKTLTNCQSISTNVELQVQEIAQQFEDFKDKTSSHTLST